jgi:NAD-dependent deacetylase
MLPSQRLVELLHGDPRTVVLTGAGVSAESGVPTFRGNADSLWSRFDPRELASMKAFLANPELVWEWYLWRRKLIAEVEPNAGHFALAHLEEYLSSFTLVTQNVDNLHQRAGSKQVIELHGNILRNKCSVCQRAMLMEAAFDAGSPPTCPCGGKIRPDVVWFGEMLPEEAIDTAIAVARNSEVFFCVGTSAEVFPAADLPVIAKRSGAYLIEINPEETRISAYADEAYRSPSGVVLSVLWEQLEAGEKLGRNSIVH